MTDRKRFCLRTLALAVLALALTVGAHALRAAPLPGGGGSLLPGGGPDTGVASGGARKGPTESVNP